MGRGSASPRDEQRRPVTIVLSDLKGSTALAERFDAETLRAVLTRYFDEMRIVLESHGGSIAKIIGDAIVTVFDGTEDPARAARRGARAAIESQAALEWLNDRFDATWGVRLQNRTGVASGYLSAAELAEAGAGSDVLAGEVLGTAETLESNAPTMEALIDEATLAFLGDAASVEAVGPVPRKGAAGTVDAWRLVSVRAPAGDAALERPADTARPCPVCGHVNGADDRRCRSCGSVLAAGDATRESRRMVTIVFADPKPQNLGDAASSPDATRRVMSRYVDVMRPILERHGGTVEKFVGDALMAVFGLPVRHEDDAIRAVRAAAEMRAALVELNTELEAQFRVRLANPVGVNTGTVVAGDVTDGQRLVTGDAVNVAARLEQTAGPGEVLLGDLTRRLVGSAAEAVAIAPLALKGKAEPVPAFQLVRVVATGVASRRHDLPLVGRDVELDALRETFQATVLEQRGARVTLIGDAGVGKSRLTHEFLTEAARTARVVHGNCLAYGEGITFWPLLRVVQDAAGIEEGDDADTARARIAAVVGGDAQVLDRVSSIAGLVDTPYAVPELVWGMRRFLEHLAATSPLIVAIDDVHWAEPTLLDVVEQLARSVQAPVTMLCAARPAVFERHRQFVDDAPAVVLEPLTDEQCERFLRLLLGETGVEDRAIRRIVEAAGGNPLFIEQLLSMLIDDGRLRESDGLWRVVGDLSTLQVPASIEALLAARLDRLPVDERRVIEPASVIGRRFAQDAVEHLVDADLRVAVGDRLDGLVERDLVLPEEDADESFRFQHQLIRDATYNSLLKEARAILHERFVRWADTVNEARDRATEFEEIQGYHLEQAYRYWLELGPVDAHAVEVGIGASGRLASAGERALGRGDMPAAANLLSRAAAVLPEGHPAKSHTLLLAANALHETGAFDEATAAYERSARCADSAGDAAGAEAAQIEKLRLHYLIGRVDDVESITVAVEQALGRLNARDDDALSRVWQLQLNLDIAACRWAAATHAANRVIEHAQRAGNALLEVRTMPLLAFLAQKGPMPVPEAMVQCEDILRRVSFDRRSWALTRLEVALLSAMALDVESARAMCTDVRHILEELGWEMQAALVSLSSGPIELLVDDPVRAESELRRDYDTLQGLGERNFISLIAAFLAEAVYRQRRFAEAQDLVDFCREIAAPDDLAAQIVWRSVAGKLAARSGNVAQGVDLAREAFSLIETAEDPSFQADVLLDLAEVLFLADQAPEAVAAGRTAVERHGIKGNTAGVQRAARALDELTAGRDPLT
jgi:class 3 adenylate cyclase/tetratricopeptide (TPR) repeat protein